MATSLSDSVSDNSPKPSEPLIRLENVDKIFQMGEVAVQAMRDVSLDIYRGELLAMVGPSGSGKSTILNIVGGLDSATSGKVWYGEQLLSGFSARDLTRYRRDTVGFVFQFYNLVPTLTARENVMVSTEISDEPMDVLEALRLVDLQDRADHFPSQMSGGEQQRVAIARALAKKPELLLCDEPTGALDFVTGKRVLRLLVDLKNRLGKAIVMITHNSALAQAADRVIRLRSGQVVEVKTNARPVPPEDIVW
ncbi:MAG: ABC transporter ATP-binding protein [Planctomycetota bacterium]|nr:ABC transporter ATP-binding protein [Planctomycetota bacterium]